MSNLLGYLLARAWMSFIYQSFGWLTSTVSVSTLPVKCYGGKICWHTKNHTNHYGSKYLFLPLLPEGVKTNVLSHNDQAYKWKIINGFHLRQKKLSWSFIIWQGFYEHWWYFYALHFNKCLVPYGKDGPWKWPMDCATCFFMIILVPLNILAINFIFLWCIFIWFPVRCYDY